MRPITAVWTCALILAIGTIAQAQGPKQQALPPSAQKNTSPPEAPRGPNQPPPPPPIDSVLEWNDIANDAVAQDHSFADGVSNQGGPTRTARALAMVHVAMFDAANSIERKFTPYLIEVPLSQTASLDVAVATAGHDVLRVLYPKQATTFAQKLQNVLIRVKNPVAKTQGQLVGKACAQAVLLARTNDNSNVTATYTPSSLPGKHRVDPLHPNQGFLTPGWGQVLPFGIRSAADYPLPPPPSLTSPEYTQAFNEVKLLGEKYSSARTADQTIIGIFWGYDGTKKLGTPPRLYNQAARAVMKTRKNSVVENARILALVNVAMADAGIAAWKEKYRYSVWRPILGVREADEETGPTGQGDGNPETIGDTTWEPLGAPASNQSGTDFTPSFPSYASGHATFGAATFRVLQKVYGTDHIPFDLVSDEYNGVTTDSKGQVRPRIVRHFQTLSQAIEENGQSRIYLGIHWSFDKTAGIRQGSKIADYVVGHTMKPKQGSQPGSNPPPPPPPHGGTGKNEGPQRSENETPGNQR